MRRLIGILACSAALVAGEEIRLPVEAGRWVKQLRESGEVADAEAATFATVECERGRRLAIGPWRAGATGARFEYASRLPVINGTARGWYKTAGLLPRQAARVKGKPYFVAWFADNEREHRELHRYVYSPNCAAAPGKFVEGRYRTIAALNKARGKSCASFDDAIRQKPDPMLRAGAMYQDLHLFRRELLRRFNHTVLGALREEDPERLDWSLSQRGGDAAAAGAAGGAAARARANCGEIDRPPGSMMERIEENAP
ncbi:MAG: beta-galactosidase [Acidobacteriota bacterium]